MLSRAMLTVNVDKQGTRDNVAGDQECDLRCRPSGFPDVSYFIFYG